MLNPFNLISKIFKSSNQKKLDNLAKVVTRINDLEENITHLKDSEFPKKTIELKQKLIEGITLDDLLPEAFAVVREASKRFL